MLHKLQHLMGWNTGRVISLVETDGNVTRYYIAFKCSQCGSISGVQHTMTYRNNATPTAQPARGDERYG